MLKKLVAKYGQPLGQLLLQKRREVESHCPSGHYPVLVRQLCLIDHTLKQSLIQLRRKEVWGFWWMGSHCPHKRLPALLLIHLSLISFSSFSRALSLCPGGGVQELWADGENLSVPKALKALLTHVKLEI